MNANPLPAAELLPVAPGTAPAGAGAAAPERVDAPFGTDPAGDPRGAADFAALLQSAGFAAIEAQAAGDAAPTQPEAGPQGESAVAVSGAAIDGLLFLAAVQAQPGALVTTAGNDAAQQSAAAATPPGGPSPLAARVRHGGRLDPGILPGAPDPADPAPVDPSLSGPALAGPLAEAPKRPVLEALLPSSNPVTEAPSARFGGRGAPESDAMPALVPAPSLEAVRRPALEAIAPEAKPVAAAASAEPTPAAVPPSSATPPAALTVEIDTPLHDPGWRVEAASRIASLVTRGVEHAEVRITPPELGPVEMRIDVRGGETTLAIVATQATTRDALEQALPLLRDMLAQQGLALGQATVQDGRADQQANGGRSPATGGFGDKPEAGANLLDAPRPGLVRRLIDVFA